MSVIEIRGESVKEQMEGADKEEQEEERHEKIKESEYNR